MKSQINVKFLLKQIQANVSEMSQLAFLDFPIGILQTSELVVSWQRW